MADAMIDVIVSSVEAGEDLMLQNNNNTNNNNKIKKCGFLLLFNVGE